MKREKRISLFLLVIIFFFTAIFIAYADPGGEKYITVTVLKSDNLVNICKKYLESPGDWKIIADINHLDNPHRIYPGESLRIPAILLKGTPIDGTVSFINGQVMYRPPGSSDWTELVKGDTVCQGSQIKTGIESAVEIIFEDGASFFLRPETIISIEAARKKAQSLFIRKLFMPVGKTLMKIKKSTGRESRFEIQTPSAVSAARGTEFRVSVRADDITRTEVLSGIVGVTGRGREVHLGQGEGTLVKKGNTPTSPRKLLAPPSVLDLKTLYQTLPSEFRLTRVEKAVASRIMLSIDPLAKNVVKTQVISPSEAFRLDRLEDGAYYCQTSSIDSDGLEGLPSKAAAFRIRVNPLPPFIQKPLEGEEFRKKTVALEWLNVPDAAAYQVQVSADPDFRSVQMEFDQIKGVGKNILLNEFSDYYFRVRSIAEDGFRGLWSDTIRFTFLKPPEAPPVEAPQMDESTIHLRWQDLGQGITYHFQMASDSQFADTMMDRITKKPEIAFKKPEKAGVYHIRVSALDSDGYEGGFTPPQSFEIEKFPYWEVGTAVSWALIVLIIIL